MNEDPQAKIDASVEALRERLEHKIGDDDELVVEREVTVDPPVNNIALAASPEHPRSVHVRDARGRLLFNYLVDAGDPDVLRFRKGTGLVRRTDIDRVGGSIHPGWPVQENIAQAALRERRERRERRRPRRRRR